MNRPDIQKQKKLLIFGGTTEGRILAGSLANRGYDITLSVASAYGKDVLDETTDRLTILIGRKTKQKIAGLLCSTPWGACIDATHPYAKDATANIKDACAATDTPYFRLIRPSSPEIKNAIYVTDISEACRYLAANKTDDQTILFTTGAKEVSPIAEYFSNEVQNIYIRTLPTPDSQKACEDAGFLKDHILTGRGPFSKEENLTCFKRCRIDYLVTKDSGPQGGFMEKIEAAREAGIIPIILKRPKEDGYSMEELQALLMERLPDASCICPCKNVK